MAKERIHEAFFRVHNQKLYYNQLREMTGLSYSSLQNALSKMHEAGEIVREKTRPLVYYHMTDWAKALAFTRITERRIAELQRDVRVAVKEFVSGVTSPVYAVVLFGSAARGEAREGSDIDMLVILESFRGAKLQSLYEKEMRDSIGDVRKKIVSVYPLSVFFTTVKDFLDGKDYLLKEARDTGFAIVHQHRYYRDLNGHPASIQGVEGL